MRLPGSRPWNHLSGLEPTGGISNYIHGPAAKDSLTNIPHYARFKVAGVYEGVDLVFYSHGGDLEYDFVAAPGADPSQIQLAFEGTDRMRVDEQSGDLVLTTAGGSELRQVRPRVYQQVGAKRVEVGGRYRLLKHGQAAFTLAHYDRRRPLVIDPTIAFTRFLHGSDTDQAQAVAVDSSGNSYITGYTYSDDFPVQQAYDSSFHGCFFSCVGGDAFVTKLSPSGDILFSTYLGGDDSDEGDGIAVDSTGIYVAGYTSSDNFPNKIPDSPFGNSRFGGTDAFVTKLTPDGQALIYSYIISGTGDDWAHAIAVDSQHCVWVTGSTSRNFIVGAQGNSYFVAVNGSYDVFYEKIGPSGEYLLPDCWPVTARTSAGALLVDPADQPWLTGQTCGNGYPSTQGDYYIVNGGCLVFVTQLTRDGNMLMSTAFGGAESHDEAGTAIASNGSNTAYVTGYTDFANFPTTPGAYQTSRASARTQAFVTEVTSDARIVRSTLLGADDGETRGFAIVNNDARGVYIAGYTSSSHLPGAPALTPNPTAGFVSKFSQDLSELRYSQLLGAFVEGLALLKPAVQPGIPEIWAVGGRYSGPRSAVDDFKPLDAFAVKLDDDDDLPTTTTVTSSANPSVSNAPVTFEAMVSSDNGVPTGRVAFYYDGTHLLGYADLSTGAGRLSTSILPLGSHTIQAQYEGDGKFGASASTVLNQAVDQHATKLTLASSVNPSSSGQPVTLTAKIATDSGNASGSILLFRKNGPHSGPSIVGSGTLSGNVATIAIPSLPIGDNIITAVFQGSPNYAPSQSPSFTQTVKLAATTIKIMSSLNPSKAGQSVKFTVKVVPAYGGSPSGTITFKNGAGTLGTAALSGGTATLSTSRITSGKHTISAIYGGDAKDAPSSKTMTQQVK